MKQKEMKMVAYVAPDVSIYEIHSEGALCGSPYGGPGEAGPNGVSMEEDGNEIY